MKTPHLQECDNYFYYIMPGWICHGPFRYPAVIAASSSPISTFPILSLISYPLVLLAGAGGLSNFEWENNVRRKSIHTAS